LREKEALMSAPADARESLLRRGLGLKYLTVGWNVVEGVVVPAPCSRP